MHALVTLSHVSRKTDLTYMSNNLRSSKATSNSQSITIPTPTAMVILTCRVRLRGGVRARVRVTSVPTSAVAVLAGVKITHERKDDIKSDGKRRMNTWRKRT